ncbi:hypothetical protein D3C78_1311810 [compost metagenome]
MRATFVFLRAEPKGAAGRWSRGHRRRRYARLARCARASSSAGAWQKDQSWADSYRSLCTIQMWERLAREGGSTFNTSVDCYTVFASKPTPTSKRDQIRDRSSSDARNGGPAARRYRTSSASSVASSVRHGSRRQRRPDHGAHHPTAHRSLCRRYPGL